MNATTDWYEVAEVHPGCFQVTEARGALPCNSFVVTDDGEALVIDTGLGIGDLRRTVSDLGVTDPSLLLTHSHWDHIGAAHQFDDAVIDDRERTDDGRVTIDTLSEEFVDRPEGFIANWRGLGNPFPDGFDPDDYRIPPAEDVGSVAPGDVLTVGDRELELIPVPGHSPGQLAALDEAAGVLYGADVIGIGGSLYAHFQDSDVETYVDTFARLADRYEAGEFDVLATGHNDPYRGDELDVLETMRVRLGDVLDDAAEYEVVDTDWGPSRQYDFGEFTVLTATTVG